MNEAETRAEHIDPALAATGWGQVDGSRILREHNITAGRLQGAGKRARADIADYVLVYRNTKLAVIEAKAWAKPLTEGVGQAKHYAAKLAIRHTYATNGQGIYGIDMHTGAEAEVARYPTPDELWDMAFGESEAQAAESKSLWRKRFAAVPLEDKGGTWTGRYYQETAITRVLEAVANGKDRVLLTLATGTGKTFIAFQLAWKLFHSRWNLKDWRDGTEPSRRPRILFLADRNILADQAFTAFSPFPEDAVVRIDPSDIKKKGRVPKNGSVFFTIFQTFMSGPAKDGVETPYFGEYPPDFFDFIIIDECHRGGANDEGSWRAILEYFSPAVQLGLTATPKRTINADTYGYFGDPVYTYSLRDGINDGFLTPFRVKQIVTTLDDYVYTADDMVLMGDVEVGKRYTEKDFNRSIEIKEREAYRVKLFMDSIDQRQKSIVFCATQQHALLVRDLINQMKTSAAPDYCVRVTSDDGKLGEQHLSQFQDNEKSLPTILTTSQKLSTGVDARNVRNIVLMRPVNSMIEFKQIIGRGTRLYDGKDYFTIYDFVKAHLKFNDADWDGEPVEPEPPTEKPLPPSWQQQGPERPPTVEEPGFIQDPPPCPARLVVKLADGKQRTLQHISSTSYWGQDGKPLSPAQFLESLFGALPDFFKSEDELRTLWADPATRKALLAGLADKGFGREPLREMQRIIEAEKSDLFDVLAYVAFALPTETRASRADRAKAHNAVTYGQIQQAFLAFVLDQYVTQGVDQLDADKLTPLLKLRYNALNDAMMELGDAVQVRQAFVGMQRYLYKPTPD